jgi:hypothetical protein
MTHDELAICAMFGADISDHMTRLDKPTENLSCPWCGASVKLIPFSMTPLAGTAGQCGCGQVYYTIGGFDMLNCPTPEARGA